MTSRLNSVAVSTFSMFTIVWNNTKGLKNANIFMAPKPFRLCNARHKHIALKQKITIAIVALVAISLSLFWFRDQEFTPSSNRVNTNKLNRNFT
jgi:hypothetical protein